MNRGTLVHEQITAILHDSTAKLVKLYISDEDAVTVEISLGIYSMSFTLMPEFFTHQPVEQYVYHHVRKAVLRLTEQGLTRP